MAVGAAVQRVPLTLLLVLASLFATLLQRRRGVLPDNLVTLLVGMGVGTALVLVDPGWTLNRADDEGLPQLFFDFCLPPITFAAALNEGAKATWHGIAFAVFATVFTALSMGLVLETWFGQVHHQFWSCFSQGCLIWATILTPVNSRSSIRKAESSLDHDEAELAAMLKADHDRWGPLIKTIGFTAES